MLRSLLGSVGYDESKTMGPTAASVAATATATIIIGRSINGQTLPQRLSVLLAQIAQQSRRELLPLFQHDVAHRGDLVGLGDGGDLSRPSLLPMALASPFLRDGIPFVSPSCCISVFLLDGWQR